MPSIRPDYIYILDKEYAFYKRWRLGRITRGLPVTRQEGAPILAARSAPGTLVPDISAAKNEAR